MPTPAVDLNTVASAHLVGIGGAAMTPLATILLDRGVRITGSDLANTPYLPRLRSRGALVTLGHAADQVGDVDVVVISSAVPDDNPEVAAARRRGIPVLKHAAALGSLMRGRRGVAVAGTHGKTTTSALIAVILAESGLDPTFHVGSELLNYGCYGRSGKSDIFVAEADEYDRRFLSLMPTMAVITSIEADHLDYFGSVAAITGAFEAFVERVQPDGLLILCADDPTVRQLPRQAQRTLTYGFSPDADWRVINCTPRDAEQSWVDLRSPTGVQARLAVRLLGAHNAANLAAAVAIATELGVDLETVAAGVAAFAGTRRRFEVVGRPGGVTVVDDYAHHPTAVRVTLRAAREHFARSIWVVYQPHTAHRTESLGAEFSQCFAVADHVILTPTYRPSGREADDADLTVQNLLGHMDHRDARLLTRAAAVSYVAERAMPGDLVLVMGAGDIWTIEQDLVDLLETRGG